jgi:hypothetical protein
MECHEPAPYRLFVLRPDSHCCDQAHTRVWESSQGLPPSTFHEFLCASGQVVGRRAMLPPSFQFSSFIFHAGFGRPCASVVCPRRRTKRGSFCASSDSSPEQFLALSTSLAEGCDISTPSVKPTALAEGGFYVFNRAPYSRAISSLPFSIFDFQFSNFASRAKVQVTYGKQSPVLEPSPNPVLSASIISFSVVLRSPMSIKNQPEIHLAARGPAQPRSRARKIAALLPHLRSSVVPLHFQSPTRGSRK